MIVAVLHDDLAGLEPDGLEPDGLEQDEESPRTAGLGGLDAQGGRACPASLPPDALDNLRQARAVAEALRGLGHAPRLVPFSPDPDRLRPRLAAVRAEVVFNLVESVGGQGRLVHLAPAALAALGLPCTGSSGAALFVSGGKLQAKARLRALAAPIPDWLTMADLRGGRRPAPGPWIVKSVWEHASIGLDDDSVLRLPGGPDDADRLLACLERRAPRLGGECFAERFLPGREFNLSLLEGPTGPAPLPPAETVFRDWPPDRPALVGYRAKWEEDSPQYRATVRRFDFPAGDGPLLDQLAALARLVWRGFGLGGYARLDCRLDASGRPCVIDVNANPCLSPDAGFAAAAERAGLGYTETVGRVLARASRQPCFA